MPELPEVESLRRSLRRRLRGRAVEAVEVREPRLRRRVEAGRLRRRLRGRVVRRIDRRGKYLLLRVSGGATLVVHLGMTGRLRLVPAAAPLAPHDHVRFGLTGGLDLRFNDARRFGHLYVVSDARLPTHADLRGLGVEPLSAEFTAARLRRLAAGRRLPIKNFLLDQRLVAGLGNIYASEALFLAGINPRRRAGRLSLAAWERVVVAVQTVLRSAIAAGGTTLRDYRDGLGRPGRFRQRLAVYGRAGEPCRRCRATLRVLVQSGRSTFYCPSCQRV